MSANAAMRSFVFSAIPHSGETIRAHRDGEQRACPSGAPFAHILRTRSRTQRSLRRNEAQGRLSAILSEEAAMRLQAANPLDLSSEAALIYRQGLDALLEGEVPFLLGGAYA